MQDDVATRLVAMARAAAPLGRNHDLPVLWIFSDPERLSDPLLLPRFAPARTGLVHRPAKAVRSDQVALAAIARRFAMMLVLSKDHAGLPGTNLHYPERSLRGGRAPRNAALSGRLITAAAHNESALVAAARAGADAAFISPVFATRSHPGRPALGVARAARLALLARRLGLLPFALGGIETPSDVRRLYATEFAGVAGISFALSCGIASR